MENQMPKNQQIFFLTLSAVLTIGAVIATFVAVPKNTENNFAPPIYSETTGAVLPALSPKKAEIKTQPEKNINITVTAGDFSVSLTPKEGSTLFDALTEAKNNGKILFEGKQYPSLGFFVTKIESLSESGGKHLIYYINGKQANSGISLYVLKNGDVIDWKLE